MPMPSKLKEALLVSTREAAAALLSDLDYLDKQIQTKMDSHDVRRLAVILRRILVERDITTIASPRMERIFLIGPKNDGFIQLTENIAEKLPQGTRWPIIFYGSGGLYVNGKQFRSIVMLLNQPSWLKIPATSDPDIEELRIDNFLSQPVLYFSQTWIKRVTVIKHVALYGHGVHSLTPKTAEDKLLSALRKSISYKDITGNNPITNFKWGHALNKPFKYQPDDLDPILVELIAASHYLLQSPDVIKLREIIRAELEIMA